LRWSTVDSPQCEQPPVPRRSMGGVPGCIGQQVERDRAKPRAKAQAAPRRATAARWDTSLPSDALVEFVGRLGLGRGIPLRSLPAAAESAAAHSGGPRAREILGGLKGSPMCVRMCRASGRIGDEGDERSAAASRPEVVCQVFFATSTIELSSGEPRRLSAWRYFDSSYGVLVCQQR
jgi:hypothetical protein